MTHPRPKTLNPIPSGALFLAPMEGITDEAYRKTILKLYKGWDYFATDFLRVPSAGKYPKKFMISHFGDDLYQKHEIRNQTMFQILTSHRAYTQILIEDLEELGFPWLDINLGCPSRTVTKNGGGSSLLKNLETLKSLLVLVRKSFSGRLTAKIRTGYAHTGEFEDSIRLLNDVGVEAITVHGRTREMMYKEPADWSTIKRATKISQVPIIGNGDIWKKEDITRMLDETGCHGVMIARGALRAPWIADTYKNLFPEKIPIIKEIKLFLLHYKKELELEAISERGLLKQSKSVIRFMFDEEELKSIRQKLLLSQTSQEFYDMILSLKV